MQTKNQKKSQKGFTLIELAVTMVIASTLAAIAVPVYSAQSKRAKSQEAEQLLTGIAQGERLLALSTRASINELAGTPSTTYTGGAYDFEEVIFPAGALSQARLPWTPNELKMVGQLDVSPSTPATYFKYAVSKDANGWVIAAYADIDGDTVPQVWVLVHRNEGQSAMPDVALNPVLAAAGVTGFPKEGCVMSGTATGVLDAPCRMTADGIW